MSSKTANQTGAASGAPITPNRNPSVASDPLRQEWMRIPEAMDFSRLSKAKLYNLINRGPIKSVSLRERGQIKGTRLVSFDSLRAFLESRATGGSVPPAA